MKIINLKKKQRIKKKNYPLFYKIEKIKIVMEKDNFYFQQLDYLSVYPFELQQQMSMSNPMNIPYYPFPQQFMPQFMPQYNLQYNPQYHFYPASEYPYHYEIPLQKPQTPIYSKLLLESWSNFVKVPSVKVLQSFYNKPNLIISRST
jgi:hypothetical protein